MNIGNQDKLLKYQYKDTGMLDIRISLHQEFSTNKYGWHRWVFDQLLEISSGSTILEVGSGNGELWTKNLDRIPASWDVTLSDFSSGMLDKVRASLQAQSEHKYEVIDVQSIPFPEASFDVVMANHMLYHVPDLQKALSEIRRVLSPDGVFYATTMGVNNMQELRDLVVEFDSSIEFPFGTAPKIFGLENGGPLLQQYFTDIEIRYYEDSLRITEVQPLVDYVLTFKGIGSVVEVIQGEKIEEFKRFLQSKMNQDGCINISKTAGLFVAR